MSITAKELAKQLNLSEAAISMALNNKPGVSTLTRKRVLEAAASAGYDFSRISNTNEAPASNGTLYFVIYRKNGAVVPNSPVYTHTEHGVLVQDVPFFSQLSEGIDLGCRHCHYYLNISGNFAPENCGMLLALLNGRTVNDATLGAGHYNSFIQLEGWQAGAARHNADYNLHTQTLWNISTFGACPYSEKRGTAVFLAPQGWTPQVYQTTCMMPYLGAYATASQQPQAWLRRDLVSVPEDAPALPSRYIAS